MPAPSSIRNLRRRLARRWSRTREQFHDLLPPGRTAQRVPAMLRPPAPREFAAFGEQSWVVPTARVHHPERISLGTGSIVMEHSTLMVVDGERGTGRIAIGDGVTLARFNSIVSEYEVMIGDDVASSDSVTIFDTWHHPLRSHRAEVPPPPGGPVVIEAGAYLGCNAVIGPAVRIGRGAFVGEGAVVTEDVPDHAVVYGCPATVTRRYDASANKWNGPRWP